MTYRTRQKQENPKSTQLLSTIEITKVPMSTIADEIAMR